MKSLRHTFPPIQSARWLRAGRCCLTSLYFTCFIFNFSLTNGQTREQLTGIWIGVHTELDASFTCPLPTYIRLAADSTYQLGMVDGSATAQTSTWAVDMERVRLDTIHFAPHLVTVQNDLLRIGATFPMVFRRFTNIPVDSAQAYRQLAGHSWRSDNLTISLYANGRASLENLLTTQRTVHFWQLVTFGQSVFLVILGNQHNRAGGYKPLWQLASVLPNRMQAIGWNGCRVATESFQRISDLPANESYQSTDFQTCDNCFLAMTHERPLSRSSRRYDLNQLFTKFYQPVNHKDQSGLLEIKFVVNCAGQGGLFEVNGFGNDYCPKTFDSQLTNQLLTICRNHIAVNAFLHPGKEPDDQPNDTFVSLTFRLKDGHITDILP